VWRAVLTEFVACLMRQASRKSGKARRARYLYRAARKDHPWRWSVGGDMQHVRDDFLGMMQLCNGFAEAEQSTDLLGLALRLDL
jgi:hypothetical protein